MGGRLGTALRSCLDDPGRELVLVLDLRAQLFYRSLQVLDFWRDHSLITPILDRDYWLHPIITLLQGPAFRSHFPRIFHVDGWCDHFNAPPRVESFLAAGRPLRTLQLFLFAFDVAHEVFFVLWALHPDILVTTRTMRSNHRLHILILPDLYIDARRGSRVKRLQRGTRPPYPSSLGSLEPGWGVVCKLYVFSLLGV